MKTIEEILRVFDKKRDDLIKSDNLKEETIATDAFLPCAEQILCNGYFLVNDEFILDIKSIELYYHEENGDIKDYVMYHTNNRYPTERTDNVINPLVKRMGNRLPYFELGTMNIHQSGLDITFENEEKAYRASFLIREYRILKKDDYGKDCSSAIFDKHSTHIFDDLFYLGIPFNKKLNIKWCESDVYSKHKVKQEARVNVAKEYVRNEKTLVYEKKPANIEDVNEGDYFRYGKNYYLKCTREWRFTRQ